MSSKSKVGEGKVMNVFTNLIAPYYDSSRFGGTVGYAATGAVNEWIVRWILKRKISLMDLGASHVLAEPFLGVTGYYPTTPLSKAKTTENIFGGARHGVAVLIGQWLVSVFRQGFVFKMPSFMNALIVIGSKSLGRAELGVLFANLPVTLQGQLDAHDQQNVVLDQASNFQPKAD